MEMNTLQLPELVMKLTHETDTRSNTLTMSTRGNNGKLKQEHIKLERMTGKTKSEQTDLVVDGATRIETVQ